MATTRRLDQRPRARGWPLGGLRGGLAPLGQPLRRSWHDPQQLHQQAPIVGAQGIAFEPLQQPCAFFGAEQVLFMVEGPSQDHDVLGRTVRQVREGPGFDLAVFPVGLAQEDAAMGDFASRRLGKDFRDIHDYYNKSFLSYWQVIFANTT